MEPGSRTVRHGDGLATVVTNVPAERVRTDGTVEESEPVVAAPLGLRVVARESRVDGLREVFPVDVGQQVDLQALQSFLTGGRVKIDDWDHDAIAQLGEELSCGESTLGLDYRGAAKRVVSVAKPVLYDGEHLLVEAFQSFQSKNAKIKCSGMSEKFSAMTESSEQACKRAVMEQLKIDSRAVVFGPNQVVKVDAFSQKFVGLESEYHLYYMLAEPRACTTVQATIPKAAMTPICLERSAPTDSGYNFGCTVCVLWHTEPPGQTAELDHHANPKTLWFAWCPSGESAEIESFLADLAAQGPAAEAAASIDWHQQLKFGSPGQQVLDEFECALRLAEDAKYRAEFQKYQQGMTDLTALNSFMQGKAYATTGSEASTDGSEEFW